MASYFTVAEFRCQCGQADCAARDVAPSSFLIAQLDRMRAALGRPMVVASGVRCPKYNRAVQGAEQSAHLAGEAADIACATDRERHALLALAFAVGIGRVGIGRTFVHLDVADRPGAVWLYPSTETRG